MFLIILNCATADVSLKFDLGALARTPDGNIYRYVQCDVSDGVDWAAGHPVGIVSGGTYAVTCRLTTLIDNVGKLWSAHCAHTTAPCLFWRTFAWIAQCTWNDALQRVLLHPIVAPILPHNEHKLTLLAVFFPLRTAFSR